MNWCERLQGKNSEWKILSCVLTLSSEPQIWWFHVDVTQRTSKIFAKKSVLHVQHDYLRFNNQWYHCFGGLVVAVAVAVHSCMSSLLLKHDAKRIALVLNIYTIELVSFKGDSFIKYANQSILRKDNDKISTHICLGIASYQPGTNCQPYTY